MLIEDSIIQSEPEKQDKNQISKKILLQRVSFWIKISTTCQFLE